MAAWGPLDGRFVAYPVTTPSTTRSSPDPLPGWDPSLDLDINIPRDATQRDVAPALSALPSLDLLVKAGPIAPFFNRFNVLARHRQLPRHGTEVQVTFPRCRVVQVDVRRRGAVLAPHAA